MLAPSLFVIGMISTICLMSVILALATGSNSRRLAAFTTTWSQSGSRAHNKRNFIHNLSCCYGNLLIFYGKINEAWPLVKLSLAVRSILIQLIIKKSQQKESLGQVARSEKCRFYFVFY